MLIPRLYLFVKLFYFFRYCQILNVSLFENNVKENISLLNPIQVSALVISAFYCCLAVFSAACSVFFLLDAGVLKNYAFLFW